ncbi:TD and POZ domain-containing protein 1-like [Mastomys coucha]|uniref:TD and POZ domain-containing protein 1-like n=1 Tax=Mastomys coucha TaxID=35658 RepID=UPI001261C249|nr:TD and POZ domain-containing protein 1-like [Mastomys coucha]
MSGDLEAKSWGSTQNRVQEFCYEWTICNFSFCTGGIRKKITSPVFSLKAKKEMAWCLRVYPNGVDEESRDYLSAFLVLLSCPDRPVWANFEFWVRNSQGEKVQTVKSHWILRFLQCQQKGFPRFLLRDLLSDEHGLLPEDQLTLGCNLSIEGAVFGVLGEDMTPAIKDVRPMLTDDLGELWENSLFTDCSLLVAGQGFQAHKAILAAHSPVFKAMFEHEIEESLTNTIGILDLDSQVFKEMMGFIYTGKAPHLDSHSMATGMLAAAEKYGLEGLKALCELALCRNLSVRNAAHTLILADLHGIEQLKTRALDFIALHASEVSETSGWKSIEESHPYLVAEAFHCLASAPFPFVEPKVISGSTQL